MKLRWLCLVLCICVFTPSTTNNVLATSLAVLSATLSGRVTDPNGLVIAGAKVDATNVGTSVTFSSETNGEGFFVISNISPGRYRVTVEKQGFQSIIKPDVEIHVQDTIAVNFAMQVGSIIQSVMVESGAPLIQTESATVRTLVDRQFVENLPLNGRSFQSLITLTPGIVLTKTTGLNQGQFSVNGQRANANYFTVDGVSANVSVSPALSLQSAGGTLPGLAATGGTNSLVSVDALQEFKIQTSTYAPEFGRTPGGQVSIVTRSGTNEFHGSLFNYFRNDALDANDFFVNRQGLEKPPLRQNDFGGVIGGPLFLPRFGEGTPPFYDGRNRTFFFFSYEGLRLRQPRTSISEVPSLATRQNAPATVQPYLNAFPLPNGPISATGLAQFSASFSNQITLDATSVRIDHTVNDKLALFGRYNDSPSEEGSRSNSNLTFTNFRIRTLTAGATVSLTPGVSNDLRANYSQSQGSNSTTLDDFGGATPPPDSLLFPFFSSRETGSSGFSINTGLRPNFRVGRSADNFQRQFNLVDTLSFVVGSHQMKFGVDYRRLSPIYAPTDYSPLIMFNNVPAVLSGRASSVSILVRETSHPQFTNFSAFVQDTWRVNQRLTLTYGLRWELNPSPSEANGNDAFAVTGLDNLATLAVAPRGTPLYKTTYNNFAPRFGASYQLSQRQGKETILRGGFGIFYDLGTGQAGAGYLGFPFTASRTLLNVALPLTVAQAAPPVVNLNPPFTDQLLNVTDPNLKLPRTYQFNVAVEQSLGTNQTISASYVGATGRRLLRRALLANPNPNFSFVNITRNDATSDYHALQLQFQRRLSRGLQALASYTWSHSIDDASDDESDSARARGSSDFDVRHAFSTAVTYNIPASSIGTVGSAILRNFAIDAIFRAQSATPINLTAQTFVTLGGISQTIRPNLIPGIPIYLDDATAPGGRRINNAIPTAAQVAAAGCIPLTATNAKGAFCTPLAGRQGTLGRNALRGFPLSQLDLSLRRQFDFNERLNLQLRADVFNIFNHPNFGDPNGVLSSGTFGVATQTLASSLGGVGRGFNPLYQIGGPRSIQLSIKFQF